MFRIYLLLLMMGHILGDFYTQTSKISQNKERSIKWVMVHNVLYFFTFIMVSMPIISREILILDIAVSFLHALIDIIKYWYIKKVDMNKSLFFVEQGIHILCLCVIACVWTMNNVPIRMFPVVANLFEVTDVSKVLLCKWILGLLLIHKPANIIIQKMLGPHKPEEKKSGEKNDRNIGRLIGTTERAIMLMLMYMNQYSAIGLVLTAKSIARYDKITRDEKFAEYYLLGTLISAGVVIICATLLF